MRGEGIGAFELDIIVLHQSLYACSCMIPNSNIVGS